MGARIFAFAKIRDREFSIFARIRERNRESKGKIHEFAKIRDFRNRESSRFLSRKNRENPRNLCEFSRFFIAKNRPIFPRGTVKILLTQNFHDKPRKLRFLRNFRGKMCAHFRSKFGQF